MTEPKRKTGAEMARELDSWINGSDKTDVEAFAVELTDRTHRTLQQRCMDLFVACIEIWAERSKRPGLFDARNEATVKLAKKMVDATGDKYDRFLPLI